MRQVHTRRKMEGHRWVRRRMPGTASISRTCISCTRTENATGATRWRLVYPRTGRFPERTAVPLFRWPPADLPAIRCHEAARQRSAVFAVTGREYGQLISSCGRSTQRRCDPFRFDVGAGLPCDAACGITCQSRLFGRTGKQECPLVRYGRHAPARPSLGLDPR